MIFENFIVACILISAGLLTTLIPVIIGAAKKHSEVKPVEYLPPRGASPLDILIHYYGANANPHEIFNPLMLYWASRGYITIEEDCKRGLKLTKVRNLLPPASNDGYDNATWHIEKQLFECLFGNSRKVFYTLAALSGFKEFFEKVSDACKAHAKSIGSEKSRGLKLASLITSYLTVVAVILLVGLSLETPLAMICIFPLVAVVFPKVIISLPANSNNDSNGIPKGSAARFLLVPFFLFFGGVPLAVGLSNMPADAVVLIVAAFAVCILNVFYLGDKIDIRSREELKYYARICGFKKFLLLAEVRQLEKLVEDDLDYYYNILPYCYVLKITEKLKPKFDRIALDGPAWYLGELRETLMF